LTTAPHERTSQQQFVARARDLLAVNLVVCAVLVAALGVAVLALRAG
jgi:hypothetical protein